MSSGFSGGYSDFFNSNGVVNKVAGRSISMMNLNSVNNSSSFNQQVSYRSSLLPRSDLTGKRSLVEFQQQPPVYFRNVKPRAYNQQPEASSISNFSSSSAISHQNFNTCIGNGGKQQQQQQQPSANQESDRKMMNRLRELERELLLDDEEEGENDDVSVVTDTELSETIQKLLNPVQENKPVNYNNIMSPSPTTSSSSSCASSSTTISSKQLISDAAEAITDGKLDAAMELITRLNQFSNARGTPEQRLGFYIASALRRRVSSTTEEQQPFSAVELYSKEHILSTQLLYDRSPFFKLAFMAANNIMLQTISDSGRPEKNIHVIDFDIGHGLQYVYLIHQLAAARKVDCKVPVSLKLTTFKDFGNGGTERLKIVGDGLKSLSNKLGVLFDYNVLDFKLCEISRQGLSVANGDVLAVNFAFKLNKLPDESVTTENLRDEVLRRVKALSPSLVTMAEQDLNTNTASFSARVKDVFSYYTGLLDSFDVTSLNNNPERVKIEEGLSRRVVNSVACEGRDRVERCEVFGKWRARMSMAGFQLDPVSEATVDSLMLKLNSGTRGNPCFSVKNDSGGISFGWLGRNLTVVSAWH